MKFFKETCFIEKTLCNDSNECDFDDRYAFIIQHRISRSLNTLQSAFKLKKNTGLLNTS